MTFGWAAARRRAKAAELLRAAGPPSVATAPATPAPASTAANFAPTPKPDSVEAALIRLFDSYDQTKSGAVALDAFTSRWVSERMRTVRARCPRSLALASMASFERFVWR